MIDHTTIRRDMDVFSSDGRLVGKVDSVERERLKLMRRDSKDGEHHFIPMDWVSRVEGGTVHLARDAAAVAGLVGGSSAAFGSTSSYRENAGASPRRNWLPWIIGGLALVALIAALVQCDQNKQEDGNIAERSNTEVPVPRVAGAPLTDGTLAYDLDRFLAGKDGTPRTFTFERLNFDSGKATIRSADEGDLDDIARVFAGYPKARAAIVGYTDAEGPADRNDHLGAERAKAVIAALAQRGVASDRFEARTGGESDPTASNRSETGKFENRRTELIVLKR